LHTAAKVGGALHADVSTAVVYRPHTSLTRFASVRVRRAESSVMRVSVPACCAAERCRSLVSARACVLLMRGSIVMYARKIALAVIAYYLLTRGGFNLPNYTVKDTGADPPMPPRIQGCRRNWETE